MTEVDNCAAVTRTINWRVNLYVLWAACFVTGLSLSQITPFLPTYVRMLDVSEPSQVQLWSGLVFGVTFLISAILAPLWGRLADIRGRKLMLLRASFGMAAVVFLQAYVRSVWELLILRIAMGMTSGFAPNAVALVSQQVPRARTTRVLGVLATASTLGVIIGPLSGGLMIDLFGLQAVFKVTAGMLIVSFLVTLIAVREMPVPATQRTRQLTPLLGRYLLAQGVPALLLASLTAQLLNGAMFPMLIPLVQQLSGPGTYSALQGGLIFSAPGLSALLCAPLMGALADRVGPGQVLIVSMALTALLFGAMGYATTITQLGLLRLLFGCAESALLPCVQTLLVRRAPPGNVGGLLGFNQSFSYFGNVIGALLGGVVFTWCGFQPFFLGTGALALFCAVMLLASAKAITSGAADEVLGSSS